MQEKQEALDWSDSLWTGGKAGLLQTIVSLPFWTMKMRIQNGFPFTCNPAILYMGVIPASISISMMSMSQVSCTTAVHRILQKTMPNRQGSNMELIERCASTFLGGAGATLVSNPVGVIITQQHKHAAQNLDFFTCGYRLYQQGGLKPFYISYQCNYLINTLFTFSFYAAYPALKGLFSQNQTNEFYSTCMASLGIGLLTSVALQGPDTVKALQEKKADEPAKPLKHYVKSIYAKGGLRGFYAGFWPAAVSTATAVAAAGILVEQAEKSRLQ